MEQLAESYRETMERLKERSRELGKQMAALPLGTERDGLEARVRILEQEIREMRRTLTELLDYLAVRAGEERPLRRRVRPAACRVKRLAENREETVS